MIGLEARKPNMLASQGVDEKEDVKDNSRFQDFAARWIIIRIERVVLKKRYSRDINAIMKGFISKGKKSE